MKPPGTPISPRRTELAERLATVIQASRAIRSEVALTICESSEKRIASRQLRMDSLRSKERIAARQVVKRRAERSQRMAHAVARVLSSQGYSAFVASAPNDTASIQ